MSKELEQEQATYDRELPNLLCNEGKFVAITGDKILGIFDTYEAALTEGYKDVGLKPFFVKRIQPVENINWFSRCDIIPCQS